MIKLFLISFFVTSSLFAQKRETLMDKKRPSADLITESTQISLQKEEMVQKPLEPSHAMGGFFVGTWQPKFLRMKTNSKVVEYNFEKPLNVISTQYDTFPLRLAGRWGFGIGMAYSYSEYDKPARVSLHVIQGSLALAYRGEFTSTQPVIPYVKYGRSYLALVQRGLDTYNTSESAETDFIAAGFGVHLNRLGLLDSRNEYEIQFQYQRTLSTPTENRDLGGNIYQIGGSITL